MNRKVLLLVVFIILLCSVSTVFSKGTLVDHDAFETYWGKSKDQVKLIAPYVEEMENGLFCVDGSIIGGSIIVLSVNFNENDIVNAVGVIFENNALDYMKYDNNFYGALRLGATLLGIDINSMEIIGENDTQITAANQDGAYCVSSNYAMIENQYAFSCLYTEVLDKRKSNASSTESNNYSNTINTEDSNTSGNSQLQENISELNAVSYDNLNLMSDDELTNLYAHVVYEMTSRNIIHNFLTKGEYIAGRDLKPGRYDVSVAKMYDSSIGIWSGFKVRPWDEEKQNWGSGKEIDFHTIGEKGSFSIEVNEKLEIYNGEFEIIDYKPFLQ